MGFLIPGSVVRVHPGVLVFQAPKPPQPLGQRDDPLQHGYGWDHVIDEVDRSLRHVPAVAGRAHAPSLAREGDEKTQRALCADRDTWAPVQFTRDRPLHRRDGLVSGQGRPATAAAGRRFGCREPDSRQPQPA